MLRRMDTFGSWLGWNDEGKPGWHIDAIRQLVKPLQVLLTGTVALEFSGIPHLQATEVADVALCNFRLVLLAQNVALQAN